MTGVPASTSFPTGEVDLIRESLRQHWTEEAYKFREPDVMFFSSAHRDRIGEKFVTGPDLVAEVLSPGTARADPGTKMEEYARAEIPECWVIDPVSGTVKAYLLSEGSYGLIREFSGADPVESVAFPGLSFPAGELFA